MRPFLHRLNNSKPKTAAAMRVQRGREPKLVEDVKTAIFMRTTTTSEMSSGALKDLYALKKPDALMFSKRNETSPFADAASLDFLSRKNDAALFCVAGHSKKRPHHLVFARMFDYSVLDMMELSIEEYIPSDVFETEKTGTGMKPGMIFLGAEFQTDDKFKMIANMFIDFFGGEVADAINLQGLEHVMTFTINCDKIYLRTYKIALKKSGTRIPKVELVDMGPFINFKLDRVHFASDDKRKPAMRIAKEKKQKNVTRNILGDKTARVHMKKQDLGSLQLRKVRALNKNAPIPVKKDEGEEEK